MSMIRQKLKKIDCLFAIVCIEYHRLPILQGMRKIRFVLMRDR